MILALAALIDFIINIPFGYWRASEKQFSFNWFLSIHITIPFIVLLRHYSGIGFALYTYPIMILSFFSGQYFGKIIYKYLKKKGYSVSKCICKDVFNIYK